MSDTITRVPRTNKILRRNYAINPRVGATIDGYDYETSPSGTHTLARITGAGAPLTTLAARLTLNSSAGSYYGIDFARSAPIYVAPGEVITFSAYGRTLKATTTQAIIQWTAPGGGYLSQDAGTASAQAANTWVRRSVTATAPAGAEGFRVVYRANTAGVTNDWLDVTCLLVERASTVGSWFDGAVGNGTPNPEDLYWWAGAVNASISNYGILEPLDVITPTIIDGFEGRSETRTIVHSVIGSTTTNITFAPPILKTGVLTLVFASKTDANNAYQKLRAQAMFALDTDQNSPIDMTFVVTGGALTVRLDPETRAVWLVEVPFQEVA